MSKISTTKSTSLSQNFLNLILTFFYFKAKRFFSYIFYHIIIKKMINKNTNENIQYFNFL